MPTGRQLGDAAELFVLQALGRRGYSAKLLPTNAPTYDIEVFAPSKFFVSVKASAEKQHVRMGALASVERLKNSDFVFALMPKAGSKALHLEEGQHRLLIIPAEIAKRDAIAVRNSYIEHRGLDQSYSYSLMVKGYARREHQRRVWARWAAYEDAWWLLPGAPRQ